MRVSRVGAWAYLQIKYDQTFILKPFQRRKNIAFSHLFMSKLKGLLHDQAKFHKLLQKSGFVKPNPSVQCLSLGREGARLSSNAACRDGMSHLRYICHDCGNK